VKNSRLLLVHVCFAVCLSGNSFAQSNQAFTRGSSPQGYSYSPQSNPLLPESFRWIGETLIENDDTGDATLPTIAIDGSGNAIAVWRQFDGTRLNVWANRYVLGSGWGTPIMISASNNVGYAHLVRLVIDRDGNAIAVWNQNDGSRYSMWANRYAVIGGWGSAVLIETDNTGDAWEPQLAGDANGNAIAVWKQFDGVRFNIWANRYTAGSGWGVAALLETDPGRAGVPQISLSASGDAFAVWSQFDGVRDHIWASRYDVANGWGTAELIENGTSCCTYEPQIASDTAGNAIALWRQWDGTRYNLWARSYGAGSVWGTPTIISAGDSDSAQIASDSAGNFIAVWAQFDGARWSIVSNRYTRSSGWGTPTLIETDNAGNAYKPQIGVDSNGNATAVWQQSDGTSHPTWLDGTRYNIWSNRYTSGIGWGTAVLIESNDYWGSDPRVAVDIYGNAMAVWMQYDGVRYNTSANRFMLAPPPPPPPPNPCPVSWLHGNHNWSWKGIPGILWYGSYEASSWTTSGTSAGSCGIPLAVDVLDVGIALWNEDHPLAQPVWGKSTTGFNTSSVSVGDHGWSGGDFPVICGAVSQHHATKNGITWSVSGGSGCRQAP
jgi:hypothetical protein